MPTLITKHIADATAWAAATGYSVGNYVKNDGGKIYICTDGGTSAGSGGPTGTGAGITDNDITWDWVVTPDYNTIADWNAAITTNLVTADEEWLGLLYNSKEFLITANQPVGVGKTVDATRKITLKPATGHGFAEHPDVLTNPIKYDQSKGVGIRTATTSIVMMNVAGSSTVVEGVQFYKDATDGFSPISLATATQLKNFIFESRGGGCISANAASVKCINGIAIDRSSLGHSGFACSTGTFANCTAVRPSDLTSGGTGFLRITSTTPLGKNCASFGFPTGFQNHASWSASSGYNATDVADAPGSNNLTSLTYADQFVSTANATRDFRLKAGNDLVAGTRDQTNTNDLDIFYDARSTTTPTIGAQEYVADTVLNLGNTSLALSGTLGLTATDLVFNDLTGVLLLYHEVWDGELDYDVTWTQETPVLVELGSSTLAVTGVLGLSGDVLFQDETDQFSLEAAPILGLVGTLGLTGSIAFITSAPIDIDLGGVTLNLTGTLGISGDVAFEVDVGTPHFLGSTTLDIVGSLGFSSPTFRFPGAEVWDPQDPPSVNRWTEETPI
jgi:hypothetical protein